MAEEKEKWKPWFGEFTFPTELDLHDENKKEIVTGPTSG